MAVTLNSSSPFVQFSSQYSNVGSQTAQSGKPVKKNKMSKTGKVMIGLGALAAVSIACISLKKSRNSKQIMNSIKWNFEGFRNSCEYSPRNSHFGFEQVNAKLAEIQKLSKAQQQKAMQAMYDSFKYADAVMLHMENGYSLPKGMNALPADVKLAYEKKELFKTADLMRQKLEQLPNARKLKNEGATVAETIKNTFGEKASINPHTYDLSKESPVIAVYRNCGGYKEGVVGKEGIYWDDYFTKIPDGKCAGRAITSSSQEYTRIFGTKAFSVQEGVLNVDGAKRRVLRIMMDDPKGMGDGTKIEFCIMSPNAGYTPAQKDLLKIVQNPKKIDIKVFETIAAMPRSLSELQESGCYYLNLNYDLILSAIQSMAK